MKTDSIRMGIIGTGSMGRIHAESIQSGRVPGMCLKAVAGHSPEGVQRLREDFPAEVAVYPSAEDLIESGSCDAVLIAAPHREHPRLAMEAFAHGLHVMCEKPAGVDTKQVRAMNEAARESGKVFGMMFNQRADGLYKTMHVLLEKKALGEIKRVNWIITDWYRHQAYYDSRTWRATWAGEGGGVLINQCPHNLDLLQWLCGMPSRVRAFCHEGKWHEIEVEDDVTAYLEFPNGATGVFVTSTGDAPGTNRLEITGELGKLLCENGRLFHYRLEENERQFCRSARNGFSAPAYQVDELRPERGAQQHVQVLRAFAGKILRGTPLVAEGEEGIRELMISNAMYLSSWLGRMVEIPFDEELFAIELEKRARL